MTGIPKMASNAASFVPGLNWIKIAKIGVPIIAALIAFFWLRGVLHERAQLRDWQSGVVTAVAGEIPGGSCKDKKGRPVDCVVTAKTAVRDIQWLGREYRTKSAALDSQSAKLMAAQGNAAAAQNDAAEARKRAAQRDEGRRATRAAILAPGRTSGLTDAEWNKL